MLWKLYHSQRHFNFKYLWNKKKIQSEKLRTQLSTIFYPFFYTYSKTYLHQFKKIILGCLLSRMRPYNFLPIFNTFWFLVASISFKLRYCIHSSTFLHPFLAFFRSAFPSSLFETTFSHPLKDFLIPIELFSHTRFQHFFTPISTNFLLPH